MPELTPLPPLPAPEATPPTPFVVGICLDGPLRDITEPFYRAYVERFGPEAADQTHTVSTRWQTEEEAAALVISGEQEADDKLRMVIETEALPEGIQPMKPLRLVEQGQERPVPELDELNPFNLLQKLDFHSDEEVEDFVQGEGFFIFARAPQAELGLPTWLNQLYYGVKAQGGRIVLLANDQLKLRPAALFFAANLGAPFDEVRFVDSADGYWDGVDVLITASHRLATACPEGKRVAYCLRTYNNPAELLVAPPVEEGTPLPAGLTPLVGIQQLLAYFPH